MPLKLIYRHGIRLHISECLLCGAILILHVLCIATLAPISCETHPYLHIFQGIREELDRFQQSEKSAIFIGPIVFALL